MNTRHQSTKTAPTTTSMRGTVTENLRIIRLVRDLSQETLATLAGLDRSYLGGVERAQRNLSLDNLEKIACALKISIPELLKEPDHQQVAFQVLEAVRNTVANGRRKRR